MTSLMFYAVFFSPSRLIPHNRTRPVLYPPGFITESSFYFTLYNLYKEESVVK